MSMRPPPTYEEVTQNPGHYLAENLNGSLVFRARFANRQVTAKSVLGMEIGFRFHGRGGGGGPGGWWILDEPEIHLGTDVVIPTLAGYRQERLRDLPDGPCLNLAPDWVCEVLTPFSTRTSSVKLPIYAKAMVRYVWLVDPLARSLVIFRHTGSQWLLVSDECEGSAVRAVPFDAVEIDIDRVFQLSAGR